MPYLLLLLALPASPALPDLHILPFLPFLLAPALPALHKLPALPALPFLPALAYEFRCIGGKLNGQRETGEAMQCLGRDDGANLYLKPSKRTVIRYLMKTNIPLIPYTMTSTSGNLCH